MGVPHDHLKRSVPEQLCDGAQIYPGHNKSTGKGRAVATPAVPFDPCIFNGDGKPDAWVAYRLTSAESRKDGAVPRPVFFAEPDNCVPAKKMEVDGEIEPVLDGCRQRVVFFAHRGPELQIREVTAARA